MSPINTSSISSSSDSNKKEIKINNPQEDITLSQEYDSILQENVRLLEQLRQTLADAPLCIQYILNSNVNGMVEEVEKNNFFARFDTTVQNIINNLRNNGYLINRVIVLSKNNN